MDTKERVQRLKKKIGKPVATLLVTDDLSQRRFIGELTFVGITLWALFILLARLADEMRRQKLSKAYEMQAELLLAKTKGRILTNEDVEDATNVVDTAISQNIGAIKNVAARSQATKSVAEILLNLGLPAFEAERIAKDIDHAIFVQG